MTGKLTKNNVRWHVINHTINIQRLMNGSSSPFLYGYMLLECSILFLMYVQYSLNEENEMLVK